MATSLSDKIPKGKSKQEWMPMEVNAIIIPRVKDFENDFLVARSVARPAATLPIAKINQSDAPE